MIEDQSFMTITVFDIDANGIRRINLDTLQWLHFNGETFQIVQ
jgi:hypothetical protein